MKLVLIPFWQKEECALPYKKEVFTMKKIIKSFTFWCMVIAIFEVCMHQIGQDSKSILLIGCNPLLKMIADTRGALFALMESGWQLSCDTIAGQISVYWYIGSLVTFMFYGLVLDGIKVLYRRFCPQKQ